ncbi:DMT family transporter [Sphingomonas montana]|uniref:DMT family transporter n=1 Tax=Sphingomonas montana TaxID=1843236 RepID=UPI00096F145D|nr:DMT family transporter [Sphingomonas montana]
MSAPPLPQATVGRVAVPFLLVTLIWGSTWLVIRDQIGVVPASWSVTYRFIVATVAMFGVAVATRAPLRIGGAGLAIAAVVGFCQFFANFNLVYRAEASVTSGLVAVVFGLLVVPNAVLGRVMLGQSLSRPFLAGSAVAMVGVAMLFDHELRRGPGAGGGADMAAVAGGIALTLAAVLTASIANVVQATPAARRVAVIPLIAWAMLFGTIVDGGYAWATVGAPVMEWRWGYGAGIAYLGLAGSALAFPLYYRVIRAIGPARAAYSSVLVPVIAMTLSTLFEGYRWSVQAGVGSALAMAGLVVALRARNPAR